MKTKAWSFNTKRFNVSLIVQQDYHYQYDGDDEDGETQAKLDSGEYIAFDSTVIITIDGVEIGSDSLGGSVYAYNDVSDFWTEHHNADPLYRNCSIMRAARGHNVCMCHYFPDMVRQAIKEARTSLERIQGVKLRKAA